MIVQAYALDNVVDQVTPLRASVIIQTPAGGQPRLEWSACSRPSRSMRTKRGSLT